MGRVKYLIIIAVFPLSSCVPTSLLWENYTRQPVHKAYALGDNNQAGAAWNQETALEAEHLALNYCKTSGGINCKIIDVDGSAPSSANVAYTKTAKGGKKILASAGTGFFVNNETLVTNYHVLKSCDEISASIGGDEFSLNFITSDEINDIAILRSEKKIEKTAHLRNVPKVKKGEQVAVYGYPLVGLLSAEAKITNGIINSTSGLVNDIRYLQFSAPIQSGNSGGPLIDEYGSIIGVITYTLNPKYLEMAGATAPQSVNFAIKSSLLIDILDQANISFNLQNQTSIRSAADIADEADGFTARILCWKN